MFVKTNFEGGSRAKMFTFIWVILNILVYGIYIINAIIPYGKEFLTILNNSLNTGSWDLFALLTPIGMILLYYIIVQIILFVIACILGKNFLNNW